MLIEKKEIDLDAAAPILEKLSDAVRAKRVVSLGKFVTMNFDIFFRSGGSVKQVYEYLKTSGLDVGTYHSFRSACNRVRKQRRLNASMAVKETAEGIKTTSQRETEMIFKAENSKDTVEKQKEGQKNPQAQDKVSKYNPMLPPIILPGGVEAFIDPETGGKCFEI